MDLRRQRHLSENPGFVTKIVIAAYAKSIGGVKAEIFAVEVTLLFTSFHRGRKKSPKSLSWDVHSRKDA